MWKWLQSFLWQVKVACTLSPEPTSPKDGEKLSSDRTVGENSTLIADGPTRCSLERLDREQSLIIDTRGKVRGSDQTVEVRLTINDEHTLRELSGLLLNAIQRLEPPYFSETDIGPLWEDEHPDIYEDARSVLGDYAEEWLHSPNLHFALKTPAQIIASGKAFWVRSALRGIRIGQFS